MLVFNFFSYMTAVYAGSFA